MVSPYFLHDWVEKNSIVSGSPDSLHLVEEAKLFHLLPDRRPDFEHSARFTPAQEELGRLSNIPEIKET